MVIKGKLVSLKLIQKEDIELIRNWRNSRHISKHFIFREYITKEQQKKWFEEVSTSGKDFYFLIIVDNEPIGMIETKNIDWDLKEGETGIYIAKEDYRDSLVPFEASMLKGDHSFYELKLLKIRGQVLESNKPVLRYGKWFGFKEVGKKEVNIDGEICKVVLVELTKDDYEKNISKTRELINKAFS